MKPIIKREEQDTILTSEITSQHIVVAVIEGKPCLYTKGWCENSYLGSFKTLTSDFSLGNGYSFKGGGIKIMVERVMEFEKDNVAVFHQSDWKKALQWLIDNCE